MRKIVKQTFVDHSPLGYLVLGLRLSLSVNRSPTNMVGLSGGGGKGSGRGVGLASSEPELEKLLMYIPSTLYFE